MAQVTLVATHIIEFDKADHSVVVVDNHVNSNPESLRRVAKIIGKDIPFYEVDVRDMETLSKVFDENKFDAVIHFAGLKAVGESVSKPLEYYHNNMTGTFILLDVMRHHGCKNIIPVARLQYMVPLLLYLLQRNVTRGIAPIHMVRPKVCLKRS